MRLLPLLLVRRPLDQRLGKGDLATLLVESPKHVLGQSLFNWDLHLAMSWASDDVLVLMLLLMLLFL